MISSVAAQPTLIAALQGRGANLVDKVVLVLAGTALLFISARAKVPLLPVPITMQTFAVLVLGMAYGWRLGAVTVIAYLAEGAVGLSVFADTPEKGIGIAYMVGPTGGYLIGFVAAAAVAGYLAERGWDRDPMWTAAAMLLGNAAIYVPGVAWLAGLIGIEKAIQFGLMPFLLGDALKLVLATALLPLCWTLVRRFKS